MRVDLPVFKRCCLCFPLRYGLIGWGVVKLFTSCLAVTLVCLFLRSQAEMEESRHSTFFIVITIIAGLVGLVDFGLTITYIIGCYKKNVKLLRLYYYHSTFLLALTIAFGLYGFALTIFYVFAYRNYPMFLETIFYAIINMLILISNVVIQIYIILQVKSEITKLENGNQFRFVNIPTEERCDLTIAITNTEQEKELENTKEDEDTKVAIDVY